MNKRAFPVALSLLMIGAIILSACGTPATPPPATQAPPAQPAATQPPAAQPAATQAPAAQPTTAAGGFDWKQQQGKKITVFLSETPMAVAIRSHIQEFQDLTGIQVDYLVVAENEYWSKLSIDLSSGAGQYNVFMSGPTLNWGYASGKQIQALDPYISDPTLTPADWNQADFYPWALSANRWDGTAGPAGLGKGSLWAIPIDQVNNLLTYRKDLFDKYNIPVPTTWDEWAATAKTLADKTGGKVDGKPFYPVAQRGALDTTTLSGPFYSGLISYGGMDFNPDLTPAVNNPKSVAFQTLYMDTIKKYGTPEWPNQMWMDVQNGFTSGQYGMVIDVGDFVPTYEGASSAVAGKLGYADMPAGPDGKRLSSVWTWGFSMNAQTKGDQAKAAWLFMMWASTTKNMTEFAKTGSWPTRVSVWNDPAVVAFSGKFGNGSFRTAFDKVLSSQVQWLVSPMVDSSAVENIWVKALQDYYFGKGAMQALMDKVATDMTQEMTDSGTLKAGAQPAAKPTAAPAAFDWKQEQGKKITVFLSETPMAVAIRSHIQEFQDLTGIQVDYLVVAENEYWSKLSIDLSSGAGQYNVFMSGPTLNWGYASGKQIQALDPYISDPTLTPADWNQADFYPWALSANRWDGTAGPAGLGKGSLWAIPIDQVNNLLTYRKDLFDKYNIPVPTTWDEWAATAKTLADKTGGKVDGKPFYPVAQRGALDTTTLSGPFYSGLISYGGMDFNPDLTPAVNNPKSVAFQTLYMDTIKKYGTPEWPNQMWMDVQNGFTSGQYGMVIDVGDFVPTYEGASSAVAGKLGYADMPAGPDGKRLSSVWTWGFSMNAQTKGDQAKAAWLFMMWASTTKNMTEFAKTGSWPTRVSVWNDPAVVAFSGKFGNGSFRTAFDKVLSSQVQWLVSPMVDSSAVENIWVKALQDYYFGKGAMQALMDKVATDMTQEMKDSGTLK